MMENKKTRMSIVLAFILIFIAACGANEEVTILETPYEQTEFLMGTYVSLQVYDEGKEDVIDEAFARVEELEDKISMIDPDSEVAEISQAAGEHPVAISEGVYYLIETAAEYSAIPDSGFDYTIGPITNLWRIGFDDARVPEPAEIETTLPLVNQENVELNPEEHSVFLTEPGMEIDLGAIAKGYITDEVAEVFKENDVTTAIMDLGGNIVIMGDSPTREEGGFNVGIQDPLADRGNYVGAINLVDKSIVTSGIYERYIEEDGVIYHHLMEPETGYPFDNNLASVTIISEKSIDGDALSTVVFGFGLESGLDYVNNQDDIEAIFITKDREIYMSDNIVDDFSVTNDTYTIVDE